MDLNKYILSIIKSKYFELQEEGKSEITLIVIGDKDITQVDLRKIKKSSS